jgi:hypothetical protein
MRRVLVVLFVCSFSLSSWAAPVCSELFDKSTPDNDRISFLSRLDLEERSTWLSYINTGRGLDSINAYLRKYVSAEQNNLAMLNTDSLVSTSTLVRLGQWRQLFKKAILLPKGTVLYGTIEASELQNLKALFALQFMSVSTRYAPSEGQMVVFGIELQEASLAVPGRAELSEWILNRQAKIKMISTDDIELSKLSDF